MSDSIIQIKNVNKWFGDFQVLKEDFAESHDLKYDIVITQTRIHSYS